MELVKSMKRAGVSVVGFLALLSMTAGAQETRSEVSVQSTHSATEYLPQRMVSARVRSGN
jgi:hypothetical protein